MSDQDDQDELDAGKASSPPRAARARGDASSYARGATPGSTSATPGRQTLAESSNGGGERTVAGSIAFFESTLNGARADMAKLDRAIAAVDLLLAVEASGSLQRNLATARRHLDDLAGFAGLAYEYFEVERLAQVLLAKAPRMSAEAWRSTEKWRQEAEAWHAERRGDHIRPSGSTSPTPRDAATSDPPKPGMLPWTTIRPSPETSAAVPHATAAPGAGTAKPGATAAAPASLPPETEPPYRISNQGMSALVQRDWLRKNPLQSYRELVHAMHAAGAFPWASAERLERLAASYDTPKPTAPEMMTIGFGIQALATVGLPSGLPHQIERVDDDLMIALAITGMAVEPYAEQIGDHHVTVMRETTQPRRVASASPDRVINLESVDNAAVYRALAGYTGLAVVDQVALSAVVANPTTIVLRLYDSDLAGVFGARAWQAWKAPARDRAGAHVPADTSSNGRQPHGRTSTGAHAAEPASASTAVHPPTAAPTAPAPAASNKPGHTAAPTALNETARELTPAEHARVTAWLHDAGAGPVTALPRELVTMIDEIEAAPTLSLAVKARLATRGAADRTVNVVTLRRVIDRAKLELARTRLGLGSTPLTDKPAADVDPIGLDVPAKLVQRGLLLSGHAAHFDLVLDWSALDSTTAAQRDAFAKRPWHAVVEWVFERSDMQGPAVSPGAPIGKLETVRVEYAGNAIGIERTFKLGPHEPRGVWTVHAILHTSHFAPKQITTSVEVKTEAARMTDLRAEAFAGLTPEHGATEEPHRFPVGGLSALPTLVPASLRNGDTDGTVTRGDLPAKFQVRNSTARAANRAAEIARTEQLIAYLSGQRRDDNTDAIAAATRRIAQLHIADREIGSDQARGRQSFELRGTYLSRQPEVPSGALDLYGTVKRERTLGPVAIEHVEVQIRDHTQRIGPENFTFTGLGATFQAAFEDAFVALCKQYPEGKLAVMAQDMNAGPAGSAGAARGTGDAIGFELATTSPWKRLKSKVYNPAVQAIVNVAATALMVFQPELAPLLLPLLTVTSTVANVDELVTKHANGTLTTRDVGVTLAQVGLDFLPYAKGARLLQTEARLVAFEVANHAGMAVVMALHTREEIAQIENGEIPALAEQYRALLALEKSTNPSDPELERKRTEIAEGAQRIRDTTRNVWTKAVGHNGIFMVGSHVLTSIQRTRVATAVTFEGEPAPGQAPRQMPAQDAVATPETAQRGAAAAPHDAPAHGPVHSPQGARPPEAAPSKSKPAERGVAIAAQVPDTTYAGTGRFRIATPHATIEVVIARTHRDQPRTRRPGDGDEVILEIPVGIGIGDAELDRLVIEQLSALHDELAHDALAHDVPAATNSNAAARTSAALPVDPNDRARTVVVGRTSAPSAPDAQPTSRQGPDSQHARTGVPSRPIVLAGADAGLRAAAQRANPRPGYLDVIVHASADTFWLTREQVDIPIDHRALAAYVEKQGLAGTRVRLIACESGQHRFAVAQNLANKLGVDVLAPSETAWVDGDGMVGVGPRGQHHGDWHTFRPQHEAVRGRPTKEPYREHPALRTEDGSEVDAPLSVAAPHFDARARVRADEVSALSAQLGATVVIDKDLHNGVEVHATQRRGLLGYDMTAVVVRIGTAALKSDVLAHVRTVQAMRRYNGLLGKLRLLAERLYKGRTQPAGAAGNAEKKPFSPGSRGHITETELSKLKELIEARDAQHRDGLIDDRTLADELAFLAGQVAFHTETLQGMADTGYLHDDAVTVGAPDIGVTTREAQARGYQLPGEAGAIGAQADPSHYYYRRTQHDATQFELARKPSAPADTAAYRARVVNGEFKGLEDGAAPVPKEIVPVEHSKEAVVARLRETEGFGPYAEMLEAQGIASRVVIDAAVATMRGRKNQASAEVTVDWLRREVKQHFRERVVAKLLDPSLEPAASYRNMRTMLDGLSNADRGALAEVWYRERTAPGATRGVEYRVTRTGGENEGNIETRRADMVVGRELREVKDIEGKIDPEQFQAIVDLLSDDKLRKQMGVDTARYVMTKENGAIANLDFFADALSRKELRGVLLVEVFDASGVSHLVTTPEQAIALLEQLQSKQVKQ